MVNNAGKILLKILIIICIGIDLMLRIWIKVIIRIKSIQRIICDIGRIVVWVVLIYGVWGYNNVISIRQIKIAVMGWD